MLLKYLILILATTSASASTPASLNLLGRGYNILDGNPDGEDATLGSQDPGVRGRIFELSFEDNNFSTDRKHSIPDEVVFAPLLDCNEVETGVVFEGAQSYQAKLLANVETCDVSDAIFDGYQFSSSKRFEQILQATERANFVYNDQQTVCNLGRARFTEELARVDKYALSNEFVSDVCALPEQYHKMEYMSFLDKWGTDIVIQIEVGRRSQERFRSTRTKLVQEAVKSDDTAYTSENGLITVDMDQYRQQVTFDFDLFSEHIESLHFGDEALSQPIAIKVISIHSAFEDDYWQLMDKYVANGLCTSNQLLAQKQRNIYLALSGFSRWRGAVVAENPIVQIPITWPAGTYSLPMVDNELSCPGTPFYWHIGYRIQDTEDIFPSNDWPKGCHLKGPYTWSMVQLNFCNKVNVNEDEYNWEFPPGEYCVYKKGSSCPTGLKEGYVNWDDEELLNSNEVHGVVPEGVYDKDTTIYFCCRDDGSYSTPVNLPVEDPFFLFQKNKNGCQQVNGMKLSEEWFHWDGEDDLFDPRDFFFGSTPHNFGRDNDHKIGFCYYYQ